MATLFMLSVYFLCSSSSAAPMSCENCSSEISILFFLGHFTYMFERVAIGSQRVARSKLQRREHRANAHKQINHGKNFADVSVRAQFTRTNGGQRAHAII